MRACMPGLPDQVLLAGILLGMRALPRLWSARFMSEMLLGSSADRLWRTESVNGLLLLCSQTSPNAASYRHTRGLHRCKFLIILHWTLNAPASKLSCPWPSALEKCSPNS